MHGGRNCRSDYTFPVITSALSLYYCFCNKLHLPCKYMETCQHKTTESVFITNRDVTILQVVWTLRSDLKGIIQLIAKAYLKKLLLLYGRVKRQNCSGHTRRVISFLESICSYNTEKCSKLVSGKTYAHNWGSKSWSCWVLMRNVYVPSNCITHGLNVDRMKERWLSFLLTNKYVHF